MAEQLGRRTAVTDTRVGGSIVSKRNKIFLGWRTAGNYEVAKEKYRAPLLEERVAPREHRVGEEKKEEKRRKRKGVGKKGENRLEEELPEITENVERMKGREEETCVRSEGGKRKELACPGASSF